MILFYIQSTIYPTKESLFKGVQLKEPLSLGTLENRGKEIREITRNSVPKNNNMAVTLNWTSLSNQ